MFLIAKGLPWIRENRSADITRIALCLWLACFQSVASKQYWLGLPIPPFCFAVMSNGPQSVRVLVLLNVRFDAIV